MIKFEANDAGTPISAWNKSNSK